MSSFYLKAPGFCELLNTLFFFFTISLIISLFKFSITEIYGQSRLDIHAQFLFLKLH